MTLTRPSSGLRSDMKLYLRLAAPALLFALSILIVIVYQVWQVGDHPQEAAIAIQSSVPLMILIAQILWLGVIFWIKKADRLSLRDLGWTSVSPSQAVYAAAAGIALAAVYIAVLSPAHEWLQKHAGDYVPAGGLISSLGAMRWVFFAANVIFAPFVEETIFRGYALPALIQEKGRRDGIILSCVFFGLIHWAGGFWYMVLTALFAGSLFAFFRLRTGTTTASWIAHLSLNSAEFLYVALK